MDDVLIKVVGISTFVKVFLMFCYHSTDFEVHRNWMAITYSLPLKQWYTDETSKWTLDYPPLFAWFEYILAHLARIFDPRLLILKNLNYDSILGTIFMRLSVILSDVFLIYGVREVSNYIQNHPIRKCSRRKNKWNSPSTVLIILILCNAGLFMVDHIHFQYNGFLLGILLLSIADILNNRYLRGAFWYTVLINLKHIFLYMAPVFFVRCLCNYVIVRTSEMGSIDLWKSFKRLVKIASVVVMVTAVSFGPFIAQGQLSQIFSRLFPFHRGLCHTYWAPNIWALYTLLDKILSFLLKRAGFDIPNHSGAFTSGVTKQYAHAVLPTITPNVTLACFTLSVMPCLYKLWRNPEIPLHFVRSLVICTSCAFLFGWHVHEKAILMVIVPLSITAVVWPKEAGSFLFLSTVGHFTMFPLLNTVATNVLKVQIYLAYTCYAYSSLGELYCEYCQNKLKFPLLSTLETIYLWGLPVLFLFYHFIQFIFSIDKLYPFLPLMLISCYASVGILYGILNYYYDFMTTTRPKLKTY